MPYTRRSEKLVKADRANKIVIGKSRSKICGEVKDQSFNGDY